LKKAWASRIAQTLVSMRMPHASSRRPSRPRRARKAAPVTTVGSTNGTVTTAWRRRLPGKSRRAKT
jgi:hypothetical protein